MKNNVQQMIQEFIIVKKSVTTLELCQKFNISESTCRRVLQRLDDIGMIKRYHGGAFSPEKVHENENIAERFSLNEQAKERIAKRAAALIKPNYTIILLGGTTVFRICKYIRKMKLCIITNSMIVFNELCNYPNIQLILLGGEYKREEAELSGVLTVSNSKLFVCDHMFMGAAGYVRNSGFTTTDISSIELYMLCMRMANQTNLLIDSSKFEKRGKAITAPLDELDCIITDEPISLILKNEIEAHQVEIIQA